MRMIYRNPYMALCLAAYSYCCWWVCVCVMVITHSLFDIIFVTELEYDENISRKMVFDLRIGIYIHFGCQSIIATCKFTLFFLRFIFKFLIKTKKISFEFCMQYIQLNLIVIVWFVSGWKIIIIKKYQIIIFQFDYLWKKMYCNR